LFAIRILPWLAGGAAAVERGLTVSVQGCLAGALRRVAPENASFDRRSVSEAGQLNARLNITCVMGAFGLMILPE